MVALKEEEAFAFALNTDHLSNACSFCFNDEASVSKCKACHLAAYCNKECQTKDWINHKNECRLLKEWTRSHRRSPPDEFVRLAARILLMSEEKLAQKAFNGRTWDHLMDHVDDVKNHPDSQDKKKLFERVKIIQEFVASVKKVSSEDALKTLSKIHTNAFSGSSARDSLVPLGACILLGLSVHDHSCLPDAVCVSEGTKFSFRPFQSNTIYSPELTVSYVNSLPFTEFHRGRQEKLKNAYHFDCKCALCSDKNHVINRMGESCHVSCCKDAAGILDENSNGPYRCNKCGAPSPLTQEQVKDTHSSLDKLITKLNTIEDLEGPDGELIVRNTMTMLAKLEKILSMYNYRIIDIYRKISELVTFSNTSLAVRLDEATTPAFEYYLPERHPQRALHLMTLAVMKNGLERPDAAEARKKAYNAAVGCYGKDHIFAKNFEPREEEERLVKLLKDMQTPSHSLRR